MALLATLKKDRLGDWKTLAEFAEELRRRETAALAALANALGATPEEQRELAGSAEVLVDVAGDLRVPKGVRLSAARCAVESGITGELLGRLFAGAGDLTTDPRLGAAARRLAEAGLAAALQSGLGREVSVEAGSFARSVHAAASAIGKERALELLASAASDHAGVAAGRFALQIAELPEQQRVAWGKLLADACAAFRRAPPAARRLGLAPAWPPNLPDAFAPLVAEAEAAAIPPAEAPPKAADRVVPPARAQGESAPAERPASRRVQELGTKRLAAPIRQSGVRRSIGTVVEAPQLAEPRRMPAVGRPPRDASDAGPAAKPTPLPGLAPLPSRDSPDIRYGPDGRRVPRDDRWRTDEWQWETPVLPPSTLPPPRRAAVAAGPFEARLQALFDDRPEAVERLCAAVEARAAASGATRALDELGREVSRERWRERKVSRDQVARLQATAANVGHPEVWRSAAALLLDRLREFFL